MRRLVLAGAALRMLGSASHDMERAVFCEVLFPRVAQVRHDLCYVVRHDVF